MLSKIFKFLLELILKMKWPKITKQPLRTVTVPKLSGGLNMRDAVTLVKDNQLTECTNLWFKDGILKTRPALYTNENMKYNTSLKNENYCNGRPLEIFMNKNGELYRLFQFVVSGEESDLLPDGSPCVKYTDRIGLFWVGKEDVIALPEISESISFVTQFKDKIYVFTKGYNIFTMEIDPEDDTPEWHKVSEDEIYVPIVMTNCKPIDGSLVYNEKVMLASGATMFEGYNLLGNRYKMIYSTVNPLILESEAQTHPMKYNLIYECNPGDTVKAIITDKKGKEYTHIVTITDSVVNTETEEPGDGLLMKVVGTIIFFGDAESGNTAQLGIDDYIENNMVITAHCPNPAENLKKVFSMTQSIWFGSDALGLSGGTRLFLCGNSEEKEKSLVVWSGLNNPLYFSENCYAYVGNNTQKATAFGRQNDSLIIFKEHEIFYTQYARNDNITAEDLINQTVVDYTASTVYFPMVQLHAAIGCDLPNTVQLCRNYLVWANSDGNVYTLRSQNQYSERNIYCVSDMIKRSLRDNDLKNAYSADFDGHYFLFVERNVYVMDYNSYGYVNISGYNKTDDAQSLIPWWKWEIPFRYDDLASPYIPAVSAIGAFVLGDKLCCVFYDADGYMNSCFYACTFNYSQKGDIDSYGKVTPIKSSFTTKIFDFNAPHITKKVPLVNINFGGYEQTGINVSFITDSGTEDENPVNQYGLNGDEYAADYVVNRQFRPSRIVTRFGIKIEREGNLNVDSISLDYRILGGMK